MLASGDEMSHTRQGNNNAYCQDNAISWIDWNMSGSGKAMYQFLKELNQFYHEHPIFRRQHFFQDCPIRQAKAGLVWYRWDGVPLNDEDWRNPWTKCFGMLMESEFYNEWDDKGQLLHDVSMLLIFNAVENDMPFHLPDLGESREWELVIDTRFANLLNPCPRHALRSLYSMEARSIAVFRAVAKACHD